LLYHLDAVHARQAGVGNGPLRCRDPLLGLREKLACLRGIANLAGAFAKKSKTAPLCMQPRTHAVASFGRRHHLRSSRQRYSPDSREGVADDFSLQVALTLVPDMRVRAAAASPVGDCVAAILGRIENSGGLGIEQVRADPLHARADALAGNRTPHEDDLAVVARQHASANGGPFDVEGELRAGLH
jgi:hypothetical protein